MLEEIFYMHTMLTQGQLALPVEVSQDNALASVWLGAIYQPTVKLKPRSLKPERIKKGLKVLKDSKGIDRYVWLVGQERESMLAYFKASNPNDLMHVEKSNDVIRLALKDTIKPSDRMAYLSELEGIVYNLHRRGFSAYRNLNKTRLFYGETVDVYKVLNAVPDLNYEEYRRIDLLRDLHPDTSDEVLKYIDSTLIMTALEKIDSFQFPEESNHKKIFQSIVEHHAMARIHSMPFHMARLLAQ